MSLVLSWRTCEQALKVSCSVHLCEFRGVDNGSPLDVAAGPDELWRRLEVLLLHVGVQKVFTTTTMDRWAHFLATLCLTGGWEASRHLCLFKLGAI